MDARDTMDVAAKINRSPTGNQTPIVQPVDSLNRVHGMGIHNIKEIKKFWKEQMTQNFLHTLPSGWGDHSPKSSYGLECVELPLRAPHMDLRCLGTEAT
jgi:hypothetical protein